MARRYWRDLFTCTLAATGRHGVCACLCGGTQPMQVAREEQLGNARVLDGSRALLAQGYLDKHRTMMQLANGKAGQQNLWECSISKHGTAVLYHFRAVNQPEIDGVRNFEKYLLDVQNGYVQGKLTKEGVLARIAMENNRDRADSVNAARKRKRQLQGK